MWQNNHRNVYSWYWFVCASVIDTNAKQKAHINRIIPAAHAASPSSPPPHSIIRQDILIFNWKYDLFLSRHLLVIRAAYAILWATSARGPPKVWNCFVSCLWIGIQAFMIELIFDWLHLRAFYSCGVFLFWWFTFWIAYFALRWQHRAFRDHCLQENCIILCAATFCSNGTNEMDGKRPNLHRLFDGR